MRVVSTLLLLLISVSAQAVSEIKSVRMWQAPDSLRIVFDVDGMIKHSMFMLSNPDRVVIDMQATRSASLKLDTASIDKSWLKGIRHASRNGRDLRVVLDLSQRVTPKSFALKPNEKYGHRLVVDLEANSVDNAPSVAKGPSKPQIKKSFADIKQYRDVVIAIDAGHGGEDPGAMGRSGTKEKDVVLAIAKKLKKTIDNKQGMRAVLIRKGDYYVGLRQRINLARKYKADMLVSIHADAFKNSKAHGSSVYALSQRGASSEAARWLAASENSADLIGGVSLDDKDEVLASVLLDLSQTASIEASMDVGQDVLGHLGKVGKVHRKHVEQAGFAVLKSPDVPSILVETAFISNPAEERKLRSGRHQQLIASAIYKGVHKYFSRNPPPGTLMALARDKQQLHTIAKGETLNSIARQYNVSTKRLRQHNDLRNDTVRAGRVIEIPLYDS